MAAAKPLLPPAAFHMGFPLGAALYAASHSRPQLPPHSTASRQLWAMDYLTVPHLRASSYHTDNYDFNLV